jgi:hypothetical protein
MRIGWLILAVVAGLFTVLTGIAAILNAINLRFFAITGALVCVGLFFLTRWAWRKAGRPDAS